MDDCFEDAAIDEDEIVFDFGDGDFESQKSERQDSLRSTSDFAPPVVEFKEVPELHPPWSSDDPVRDETPKIEGHDLQGLISHDSQRRKSLETDSSQVLSSDERNQTACAQVSTLQDDDVILSHPGVTSSEIPTNQNPFSSNSATSHFESRETLISPLTHISTTDDGQQKLENVFQISDTSPLSSSPPVGPPPLPPASILPAFLHISSPSVPPVSLSPASPPVSHPPHFPRESHPPPFPPESRPAPFPPVSIPQHPPQPPGQGLTQPDERAISSPSYFQLTEDHASSPASATLSVHPSSSFNPPSPPAADPFDYPISSSPPPHLPLNDDEDDDEFDFDELVASRTQFKPTLQQSSMNVEANEKQIDFPSDAKFEADFGLKMEEIGTMVIEDNGISVLLPGQGSEEVFDPAADEWDRVQTIEPDFQEDQTTTTLKARVGTEPITFAEAVAVLNRNQLFQQFGASIRTSVVRGALSSLFHRLCGGPRLHQRLHAERDFAFCLAACPFINEDSIHCRVLFSIYKQLTGSKFDCSRFGSHWEIIGFQGQDPSTDLRGAGFLALLQLLHLVTDLKTQALARNIYRLSLHETQNFPFSVMGINLTRITIAAMREDCLNKECNRRGQVLGVLNDFYVGLFHRMHVIWKTQHKTIRDTGFVLADLESYAKKHSQEIVRTNIQSTTADTQFQNHHHHPEGVNRDIAQIDEHLF